MSSQILKPKRRKIDETEELPVFYVKCSVCGNDTTKGLHQIRLILVKKSYMKKNEYGEWTRVPPVMKREDVYMCLDCVKGKEKWPGQSPK